MEKNKPTLAPKGTGREVVRVTFRFHGPELGQIREVRDMLSLNSEVDAARYLMLRGLEAITATLTSRRVQGQMTNKANLEEMMKMIGGLDFVPIAAPSEGPSQDQPSKGKK